MYSSGGLENVSSTEGDLLVNFLMPATSRVHLRGHTRAMQFGIGDVVGLTLDVERVLLTRA